MPRWLFAVVIRIAVHMRMAIMVREEREAVVLTNEDNLAS